jgi:hypothetical protein
MQYILPFSFFIKLSRICIPKNPVPPVNKIFPAFLYLSSLFLGTIKFLSSKFPKLDVKDLIERFVT